jgi:RHS repeat-associated protein/uncharacterized repeat protein (TIGR01451 family)
VKTLLERHQRVLSLGATVGVVTATLLAGAALAMASADPAVDYAHQWDTKPRAMAGHDDLRDVAATADYQAHGGWTASERDTIPGTASRDRDPAPVRSASAAPVPGERLHTLFAGVRAGSNPGRIYDREFGEAAWDRVGQDLPETVIKLVWHPHGRYLYALVGSLGWSGTDAYIYRSGDWGVTWQKLTPAQDPGRVWRDLVVHPADPNTVFAGRVGGAAQSGLHRSDDAGDTWTLIWHYDDPGHPPAEGVRAIGISPVDPDLIFIAISAPFASQWPARILRSEDGGATFQSVYQYGKQDYPNPGFFLMDNRDRDIAYLALRTISGVQGGILRTMDGGDSWQWVGSGSLGGDRTSYVMAQSPTDNQVLYKVGPTQQNIWKSTNRGATWTRIITGTDQTFQPGWIIASQHSPDVLYVGGTTGSAWVYKSTDGGSQWTDFRNGLPGSGYAVNSLLALETQGPSHYLGICPSVAQCGDPVNTSTGNFADEWQDLSIPGPGSSLLVQRTYNSLDSYEGPLGTGWSLNYDMRLTVTETNVVEMKVEDGRRDRYISGDAESFMAPPGTNATLVRNGDGSYTLTRQDQTDYNFSEGGLLTSIVTSNELTTTLSYDGHRLIGVTDATGRTITFTWNVSNTRITGAEDPLGRTVGYGYDGGNLVTVTGLRGYTATLAYTGTNGLLSSLIEPGQSSPSFVNEYDAEGRVTSQWLGGSSQAMTFSYDPDNRQTTVADARGHSQVHTYSLQLPLTGREDSYGNTLHLTHNANNDVTKVTDERGYETHYSYDIKGNVTSIVDALDNEQSMTYEEHNNLESLTDARDVTTSYQYDEQNNLTAIVQTLSGNPVTTTFTYYTDTVRAGLLKSRTDPRGNTTLYDYDSYGNMTVITDALGIATTYTYDLGGRRTTETLLKDGQPHTIHYSYDVADNLTLITQTVNSEVVSTAYAYDEVGNRFSVTDANGIVTRYEYDDLNRLVKMTQNYQEGQPQTNEVNVETAYEYDEVGNRIKVIDAEGIVTRYEYDDLNRLMKTIQNYQEGQPKTDEVNVETTYQYDEAGNQTQVTDQRNHTTYYQYDELNRLAMVTDPLSGTTTYGYDPVGNRVSVTDAKSNTTRSEYDDLNRLVKTIENYRSGQPKDSHTNVETVYGYDVVGNRISVTDPRNHTTQYEYDELNRVITVTNPLSGETVYEYDEAGNRITVTDAEGQVTDYEYDELDRLTSALQWLNGSPVSTAYAYDAVGNRISLTDANSHVTWYDYDNLNRLTSVTDPLIHTISYSYDALGNRTAVTDGNDNSTSYLYDDLNRLVSVTDAESHVTSYGYDAAGNRTSVVDGEEVVTLYQYDELNRLVSVTENYLPGQGSDHQTNVLTSYGYDAVGNHTVITDANSHVTSYAYDELNRLISVTDPMINISSYGYDAVGNRTVITDAEGYVTNFQYDALNRLTVIDYPSPDADVSLVYDAVGSRQSMSDGTGVTTYDYDDLYRVITITAPLGTVGYSYDNVGNRTELIYPGGNGVSYSYDDANRLDTVTDWNQLTIVDYDYDAANRLTGASLPNGVGTSYQYDDANRLTALDNVKGEDPVSSFVYTLDNVGNRLQVVETVLKPGQGMGGSASLGGVFYAQQGARAQPAATLATDLGHSRTAGKAAQSYGPTALGSPWGSLAAQDPVTSTLTPTSTPTATDTITPTHTPTPTETSVVPTSTATATPTPTETEEPAPSATPTWTPTETPPPATFTPTPTATATATITPSVTPTPTVTPTATVIPVPVTRGAEQLELVKLGEPPIARPGDTITYTVMMTNTGPGNLTQVVATDELPPEVTYPDQENEWRYSQQKHELTWRIGTLEALQTLTSTFYVTLDEVYVEEVVNEVEVDAKQLAAPVTATVTTQVITPVTIDYGYDPLYRLTSASYSSGETYSYSYDAAGNRLTMVYPGGTVNYTYDAANRLTSAGGQTYTWDDIGNLLSDGVRTYQYDHANRLKQVTEGSLTTQFGYNGDGVRVGKTIGAATTDYVVDLASTLPVVISDTEAIYLYGLDIIAEQLAGADRYYYVHDGLGSVRQLLDSTGQIATRYAYDPFGVPLAGNGVSNPWQFTGEAWDAGVELLYLRARYYQPGTGRFVTKDPWRGDVSNPGTLHGYTYVLNSPVNYADPSGLDFTGPGPACPECQELMYRYTLADLIADLSGPGGPGRGPLVSDRDQLPYRMRHAPVRLAPELIDLVLVGGEPVEVYSYLQTGYSRKASLRLGLLLIADFMAGFLKEEVWFGPTHSFTQDIMDDPALVRFKTEWAQADPPYKVPWDWFYDIDPDPSATAAWRAYARENLQLGLCIIGRGSRTSGGHIDPVGGVLGSYWIRVESVGLGVVKFDAWNPMDRPSFGRLPGSDDAYWLPWHEPVSRSARGFWPGDWWGTTVKQHFYWYELHPHALESY